MIENALVLPENRLETPVQYVRGVGPQRAELLAKLEVLTLGDLLGFVPREMLDFTQLSDVAHLSEGKPHAVLGEVVDRDSRTLKGNRTLTGILLKTKGGFVRGVWFNQPYMLRKFNPGDRVIFSGKPRMSEKRWEFSHPNVQWLGEETDATSGGMVAIYSLTEGLKQHDLRRMCRQALEDGLELVVDYLPAEWRTSLGWPAMADAIRWAHVPARMEEFRLAKQRLVFDDLFEFQVGLALRRRARRNVALAPVLATSAKVDARIRRLFPFVLTAGQDEAIRDVVRDLGEPQPMHRLLQADVGAGKTVVAIYALLVAVANGAQAALMAPTELLAQQHWQTIDRMLRESRVERRLLTGQLTASERADTLDGLATGRVQLVIGTQALIQDAVKFARLGVVVIDEQHKFGVVQRARLSTGTQVPHVLVMTATPIPRSLCLTQFGDLDLTTIRELPPGRQRVVTSRVPSLHAREKMWAFIRQKLEEGRQLYVVCPRVGDDDTRDEAGAEEVARTVATGELRGTDVGVVHGRQDRAARADTMDRFRVGDLPVLVSTTVIEVGVDVPNASLMVVLEAERFGLAQLHQLRGRIGRGTRQGYCFLVSDAESPDAGRRMSALEASADGFEIAETDFELRGPGDALGARQHGALPLRYADLVRDKELVNTARAAAFELVATGDIDLPAWGPFKIRVLERFRQLMELPQSG